MSGIRKTGKINALRNLNETFNLGMTEEYIQSLSTIQMRKKIIEIRKEHNLKITKSSKYQ